MPLLRSNATFCTPTTLFDSSLFPGAPPFLDGIEPVLVLFGVPAPAATTPNSLLYIHQPVFKCTVVLVRTPLPRFHPAIHGPLSLHVQCLLVFVLHRNTKSRHETVTKKGRLRENPLWHTFTHRPSSIAHSSAVRHKLSCRAPTSHFTSPYFCAVSYFHALPS